MIKCYACGNDMDMTVVDEATGTLEICCDSCIKASRDALATNEWSFDGLYWSHDVNNRGDLYGPV